MASSVSEKFNRLINAKEQIRKSINKKGVRVTEDLPFEQYSVKIKDIPYYDDDASSFAKFASNYFIDTSNSGYQFYANTTINTVDIDSLNKMGLPRCPNTKGSFSGCSRLQSISNLFLANTNSCESMFSSCTSLSTVALTIDSSALLSTYNMFYNCTNLTTLDLDIKAPNLNSFTCQYMFYNADLSNLQSSKMVFDFPNYKYLFYQCKTADLSFLANCKLVSSTNPAPSWQNMFGWTPSSFETTDFTIPESFEYTPPSDMSSLFFSRIPWSSQVNTSIQSFFNTIDLSKVTTLASVFGSIRPISDFSSINLDIHLPQDGQLCDINGAFSATNGVSYPNNFNQTFGHFGFNGKGSASSLFAEASYTGAQYHPKSYINSLNLPYVTTLESAFTENRALTGIGSLITGPNLTNCSRMFYNCMALTSIPVFNMSKVTTTENMFYYCTNLPTVQLTLPSVTSTSSMFYNCTSLATASILNTVKLTIARYMFQNCSNLTEVTMDVANITNNYAYNNSSSSFYYIFYGCSNLEQVHFRNIKASLDISYSTKFTREALLEIIGNLVNIGASRTLHMGATNLAKLTAEDIAIATAKGWTLD